MGGRTKNWLDRGKQLVYYMVNTFRRFARKPGANWKEGVTTIVHGDHAENEGPDGVLA